MEMSSRCSSCMGGWLTALLAAYLVRRGRFANRPYEGNRSKELRKELGFPLLVALTLTIALALVALSRAVGAAATVEQYRLRRIDHTIEISFPMRGRALQWHLSGMRQELRLDLEHARLADPAEQSFGHALFPLVGLRLYDSGGGHARVVIRVSGKVDYVAAQLGHDLVIRIAPAGQDTKLAELLMAESERSLQHSFTPA